MKTNHLNNHKKSKRNNIKLSKLIDWMNERIFYTKEVIERVLDKEKISKEK